ncbi:hypothetical protein HHK36_015402 [Tetracentron sinense]|uniref:Transmembrane protein n=1 Tax=Tetracentron sinense TaxID=13715 RepID=A0A834Z4Y8_TETSI|nr:hypothetical protein HHK36_015402 [Tetracentron sinense]
MATTPELGFCGVFSESKKIVNAHSRLFLALSVLFLLPLSFSLIAFPTLQHAVMESDTDQTEILLSYTNHQRIGIRTIVLSLIYFLTIFTLSLCATGTITYSVFHGFFGRPVKLASAIKSLSNSLLRLFVTVFCAQIIVLAVSVLIRLLVYLVIEWIGFLGFQVSAVVYGIGLGVWGLGLVYLQVNWALACVVVVVESSWGLEALRRSAYLVRGMRGVAVSLLLFFGSVTGIMLWSYSGSFMGLGGVGNGWKEDLIFVVGNVAASALVNLMLLHSVAANTVLYMYCKALHGELAGEIADEFAQEYVSLPFDEEKVPNLVSVVQP